uniref:MAPEG family protein n=1 Tax=Chromera velia CCMP2878 TaxID=1169474 RepID=A0A0G4FAB8_9ALVE|eukprot:Cvel_16004.t1-p1 / transcript=Cvel_16004.t1 / gene=Cvel_16004 / organism=Chromera_velia_CCMP2878 / gene_product=hypothetical protein / transcript_product=hypothetical protein / location=Cvel_scaffold1213:48200-48850(+) / protein_length=217 / sequence_SO=supercontig / SO=protein_coding / is_pseudo=false
MKPTSRTRSSSRSKPPSSLQTSSSKGKGKADKKKQDEPPPPAVVVWFMYLVLGGGVSFCASNFCGRQPGTLSVDAKEFALPACALAIALLCYSIYDVMGVGHAKFAAGYYDKFLHKNPASWPEELKLAWRTQGNQVEQLVSFGPTLLMHSVLVSGYTAGLLGWVWTVSRICYGFRYRASAGVDFVEKSLITFTLPAYFALGAMNVATVFHCIRMFLS